MPKKLPFLGSIIMQKKLRTANQYKGKQQMRQNSCHWFVIGFNVVLDEKVNQVFRPTTVAKVRVTSHRVMESQI